MTHTGSPSPQAAGLGFKPGTFNSIATASPALLHCLLAYVCPQETLCVRASVLHLPPALDSKNLKDGVFFTSKGRSSRSSAEHGA